MEFDGGLQRAIFASLQAQFEYARVAAVSSSNYPRMVSTRPPPPPQQRAAIMPQQRESMPRHQPQRRDITPTAPTILNRGKRSTLAREGILPTPSRNGGAASNGNGNAQQRRNTTSRQVVPLAAAHQQQREDTPGWIDEFSGDEQSQQQPRKATDQVIGWEEILSGGRVQRQSRDGTHLLLVTEEPYNGMVNALLRCDVVAIRGEGPLFPTESGTQEVAADAIASVSAQVQNLGGRGRYVCCVVGVVFAPGDETSRGVVGATVHYDPSGSVFVSADVWRVDQTTDGVEKLAVLQAPVPVRVQRDRVLVHLRLRSSWPHHVMDVLVNHEPIFTNVPLSSSAGSGDALSSSSAEILSLRRMRPVLLASGGRVSLKGILCGDPPQPPPVPMEPSSSPGGRPSTNAGNNNPASNRRSNKPSSTSASNARAGGRATSEGPLPPAQPLALPPGVDPDLAARIEDEVLDRSPNVSWDDVAGMGEAKQLLNEAVVLPLIVPELFTGVLQPWKGVLLFGPPGTGKTMLAKAVATSAKTTFFNISASVIINKHFGESEKMVRALFEVARMRSPSTIFLDEVDALMGTRGGATEHEAMRRVKTELLRQMDGLHGGSGSGAGGTTAPPRVMVLATTNRPWDLDEAMRRRLEKRIYVPLPDLSGRLDLLRQQCRQMRLDESLHLEPIARRTEGFSGADLNLLCRNACMMPMRRLVEGKSPDQLAAMKAKGEMVMGRVMEDDFNGALEKMSASVNRDSIVEFEAWSKEFGSL